MLLMEEGFARSACICTDQMSMLVNCLRLYCDTFIAGEKSASGLQELNCAVCRYAALLICLCMLAF
jgi:hypothetical protein